MLKKLITLCAIVVVMIHVQVQAGSWKKLKLLKSYPPTAFHLKKNVDYLEIRFYKTRKRQKVSETHSLYQKPISAYSKSIVKKFKNLRTKHTDRSDIRDNGYAFMIDTNGKMFQMDMRKDIIEMLGTIDTPAEIQLVLWLNGYKEGQRYQKKLKGFDVNIMIMIEVDVEKYHI